VFRHTFDPGPLGIDFLAGSDGSVTITGVTAEKYRAAIHTGDVVIAINSKPVSAKTAADFAGAVKAANTPLSFELFRSVRNIECQLTESQLQRCILGGGCCLAHHTGCGSGAACVPTPQPTPAPLTVAPTPAPTPIPTSQLELCIQQQVPETGSRSVDAGKCAIEDVHALKFLTSKTNIATFDDNCTLFQTALEYLPVIRARRCDVQFWRRYFSPVLNNWFSNQTKKEYKISDHGQTVGKAVHSFMNALFYAFTTEAIDFVWQANSDSTWKWTNGIAECKRQGWACLFEHPHAFEEDLEDDGEPDDPSLVDAASSLFAQRTSNSNSNNIIQLLLLGQLAAAMFRPTEVVRRYLLDNTVHIRNVERHGSSLVAAVHVRHGDSCEQEVYATGPRGVTWSRAAGGRPCYAVAVYMEQIQRLKKKYGITKVFLGTDSHRMIEQVKARTAEFSGFDWTFVDSNRSQISRYNASSFMAEWIENKHDLRMHDVTLGAVADLELLGRADMLVASLGSHFSRPAYFLIVGRTGRVAPFISVDGHSLCCHSFFYCSDKTTWYDYAHEAHKYNKDMSIQKCLWQISMIGQPELFPGNNDVWYKETFLAAQQDHAGFLAQQDVGCTVAFQVPPAEGNTQVASLISKEAALQTGKRTVTCCLPENMHATLTEIADSKGILKVEFADNMAGFGTLFFLYPINHILLAQRLCLTPWVHFERPWKQVTYTDAEWEWYFEPVSLLTSTIVPTVIKTANLSLYSVMPLPTLHYDAPFAVHSYYWTPGSIDEGKDGQFPEWDLYNENWYWRQRSTAARIVASYIKVKPGIQQVVDDAWQRLSNNRKTKVIGIHLRGTDKGGAQSENGRRQIQLEEYLPYLYRYLEVYPDALVFAASDSWSFLESLKSDAKLSGKLYTQDRLIQDGGQKIERGKGGHSENVGLYFNANKTGTMQRGLAVLYDILLLAKCDFLLHTASAVPESAIYLNLRLHNDSVHLQYKNRPRPNEVLFDT
jgi:hypothetical protein